LQNIPLPSANLFFIIKFSRI